MPIPTVESSRLTLRAWCPADRAPLAALNADPEVMRFVGEGRPLARAESDALVERIAAHWAEHGFGLWACEVRATGELAGFAGLAIPSFLPSVLPAVEVGWRLARRCWGRGYATEAARASLDHGFRELGLREIIAVIDPANARSLRVAEKLGMLERGRRRHPHGDMLAVYAAAAPPLDL